MTITVTLTMLIVTMYTLNSNNISVYGKQQNSIIVPRSFI